MLLRQVGRIKREQEMDSAGRDNDRAERHQVKTQHNSGHSTGNAFTEKARAAAKVNNLLGLDGERGRNRIRA